MFANDRLRECVSNSDLFIYSEIVDIVRKMIFDSRNIRDARGQQLQYNCHSICRALAAVYPKLTVVDGYHFSVEIRTDGWIRPKVTGRTMHSWLKTPDGAIIDPRPTSVLSLNPIMFPSEDKVGETYAATYMEFPSILKEIDMQKVEETARAWELVIRELNDIPF